MTDITDQMDGKDVEQKTNQTDGGNMTENGGGQTNVEEVEQKTNNTGGGNMIENGGNMAEPKKVVVDHHTLTVNCGRCSSYGFRSDCVKIRGINFDPN